MSKTEYRIFIEEERNKVLNSKKLHPYEKLVELTKLASLAQEHGIVFDTSHREKFFVKVTDIIA